MKASILDKASRHDGVPLVEISDLPGARLLARCEGHNEYGSIKSKMVRHLLEGAMRSGRLRRGDRVIEASSGNTGMALAGIGAEMGLKVSIVLLDGTDAAILDRLKGLGAELHFCERASGMRGMLTYIREQHAGVFSIDQFRNKTIVDAYVLTHTDELLTQLQAARFKPDYLFACVGTGGTLQGIGSILRNPWPDIVVVAVEKEASANPIDGIRNTEVAYFGEADIYDKGFADRTVFVGEGFDLPAGLTGSPTCGALLTAIRRYPLSADANVLAILCDARLSEPATREREAA